VYFRYAKDELSKIKSKMKPSGFNFWSAKEPTPPKPETPRDLAELLAMLGPERNIILPASGDEALQRLLSVKGKDPYSILGVRSDSNDDTIRRYYKRQAVLVHPDKNLVPGAEEAFKILARAFEHVGEPLKRSDYHRQFLEAHAKEQFFGEFGNLFEQLRKKMESVSSTIKCTKCNAPTRRTALTVLCLLLDTVLNAESTTRLERANFGLRRKECLGFGNIILAWKT
jgi:DnaJ family protein C protein 14